MGCDYVFDNGALIRRFCFDSELVTFVFKRKKISIFFLIDK